MFVGKKKKKNSTWRKLQPASPITSVQEATANARMEAFSATSSTRSSGTEVTWGELPVTAILAPGYGGTRNLGSKSKDLRILPSHLPRTPRCFVWNWGTIRIPLVSLDMTNRLGDFSRCPHLRNPPCKEVHHIWPICCSSCCCCWWWWPFKSLGYKLYNYDLWAW